MSTKSGILFRDKQKVSQKHFFLTLRYGSYYIHTMVNIESVYPGLKELLKDMGISVQAQSTYALRTAIDQRGEQTINKDAKTAGKYTFVSLLHKGK